MDNKVTKQRISDHLEYDWFKYLLLAAGVIFVFIFVFTQINANREFEQINVFISCYSHTENATEFKEEVRGGLKSEKGDKAIRALSFIYANPQQNEYGTLLSTQGYITGDLLILGKTTFEKEAAAFVPWTEELIGYAVPESKRGKVEYYEKEGIKYGLKISALKDIDKLFGFKTDVPDQIPEGAESKYDTEFYLAINKSGANIGGFNDKSAPENKQALRFIAALIENYG